MSRRERRSQSKRLKTLCAGCRARKALFKYRGEVRADRDHTLCFECYRAEVNRARARRLADVAARPAMRSPFERYGAAGGQVLSERQIAHRQRMLDYLQRQSVAAS